MKILVLNAGSSGYKCCLYDIDSPDLPESLAPLWEAQIDGGFLKVSTSTGTELEATIASQTSVAMLTHVLQTIWNGPTQVLGDASEIGVIGHRVVHGGRDYSQPTLLTPEVISAIKQLAPLAPVHNPAALAAIEATAQLLGETPQIAVFDTAFHSSLPDAAAIYPIPYEWVAQGIRRYGFHGINHEDCAHRAAQILGKELQSLRIISCHLGNGCSLAAIKAGRSVDTTMGFTPLEGLMMGTRCGSIDPGILLYLQREKGYSVEQLDPILNKESGLKGISGLSGDMREITSAIAQGNERAQLAFDIYVHRLASGIGAMLGSVGGLDVLIFTAGIGEHSPAIRAAVCQKLEFLGLSISSKKNENNPVNEDIADLTSGVRVLVIQAQEDWAIARTCWDLSRNL